MPGCATGTGITGVGGVESIICTVDEEEDTEDARGMRQAKQDDACSGLAAPHSSQKNERGAVIVSLPEHAIHATCASSCIILIFLKA